MIRILLIRHGSTDLLGRVLYGRMPGIHLNDEGNRQAREVGQALKNRYELREILSSPLERAVETAKWVADAQGLSVGVDEALLEVDIGEWTGKSFAELEEISDWKHYNRIRSMTSPPGGESMMEVQSRASRTIEKIQTRYKNDSDATVALVTHGDVVRALLLLLLGMSLDHIHRLEVAPASVSEVLFYGAHPRVRGFNLILYNEAHEKA